MKTKIRRSNLSENYQSVKPSQWKSPNLNPKPILDIHSLVNHLQKAYPDYGRKRRNVLKTTVQEAIKVINKDLNLKAEENSTDNSDSEMSSNTNEKPNENKLNKSINSLYSNQTSTPKQILNHSKRRDTNSLPIVKRSRTDNETSKIDSYINSMLQTQTNLREKYILKSTVCYEDFGGIDNLITDIRKLFFHIRNAKIYKELGVESPRGILLHGPPGVGKSLFVEALVNDLQISCLKCAATEMITGISGESENKIRELFSLAKSMQPCLIFIDEIDAITPKRETSVREMEKRIVTQLITCLDNLSSSDGSGDGVMVIGTTNRLDALDPALRRAGRFDREIALGIPDENSRFSILKVICRKVKLEDNFDFESLAHRTPGFVGADLKSLIREAATFALDRFFLINNIDFNQGFSAKKEIVNNDGQIDNCTNPIDRESEELLKLMNSEDENLRFLIRMEDFVKALQVVQPSSKREGFATVPDVSWNDIGALSSIRQELQMSILAPVRYSKDVDKLGLSVSVGILLCGPPGCGKTLLAKAIANESGINFISVKGPELLNMYVGESERAVRSIFTRARSSKPCVIFFDEIDALCPKRTGTESSNVTSRVVNQLLTEMDGLESRNCFLLAATNRPDILDPAILRPGRFDKVLYVGFPTPSDRYEILCKLTKDGTKPPLSPNIDLKAFAQDEKLDGFTGADLSAIVREASIAALRDRILGRSTSKQDIILTESHFEIALNKVNPSVSSEDRVVYMQMYEKYSNNSNQNSTKFDFYF